MSRVTYREMTEEERRAALALGACTFSVGTFDKRFARGLRGAAASSREISEKQAALMWRLVWRYRRQFQEEALVVVAMRRVEADHPCSCPDAAKVFASPSCPVHGEAHHRRVHWEPGADFFD